MSNLAKFIETNQELVKELKELIIPWDIPEDFRLGDGKKITKKDFGYLLKIQGTLLSGDEEEVRLGSGEVVSNAFIKALEQRVRDIIDKNWDTWSESGILVQEINNLSSSFTQAGLTNTHDLLYSLGSNLDNIVIEIKKGQTGEVENDWSFANQEGDELNELELPIWDSFVKVIFQASLVLDLIVNKEYEDAKTQLEILKTCENEAIPKFINIQSNPEAKSKYPTLAKYISEDFQTYSQVLERSLDLSESREWQSKSGSHASHIPPPLSSKSGFETFDDFSLHSGYSRKSSKSGSDSSGTSMATANEESFKHIYELVIGKEISEEEWDNKRSFEVLKTISEKIKELQAKEVSEKEPDKKIELITEQEEQEYNEIKNVDESKVFLDKIRSKFQETGQTLTFKILEELIIEYLELLEFSKKFKTMFEQK